MEMDEVVVGLENGRPKWITINGTKVHGVTNLDCSLEANAFTRLTLEIACAHVQMVPANIENPEFAEIRKALNI